MDESYLAAAIGEPARARMLYCLMDNHARTATELAVVAGVNPSTASVHLSRLKTGGLVQVVEQGRHRYYRLAGPDVAKVLEGLSVLAGGVRKSFVPGTPDRLREARTCYDHMAGAAGVALHDRLMALGFFDQAYEITPKGTRAMEALGVDVEGARGGRRRFAFGCLDWSERRFHVGGAIGAELLKLALRRRWVTQEFDSRALSVTSLGRRELQKHFDLLV